MKLSNLAVIFFIIVIPIAIVLSEYIDNRVKVATTELEYNTKLLNSTHDAIKKYQINTVNNAFGDVTNSKISDIEDAVSAFYNSLTNNFNFTGYKSSVMKEYVPAIAFTLYDGYYIYSPFRNELTEVDVTEEDGDSVDYDKDYSLPNEITNGLKPYVYYCARYVNLSKGWDFIITYTLDNYITIMGQIGLNNYVYDCGYLYRIANNEEESKQGRGIYSDPGNTFYSFGGVRFTSGDTEELKEYVGDTLYSYAKINGKKYYLEEEANPPLNTEGINENARFFYINDKGAKDYSQVKAFDKCNDAEKNEFKQYYFAIKKNKSAYMYYKKSYEFSKAVLGTAVSGYKDKSGKDQEGGYNLSGLTTGDAYIYNYPETDNTSGITLLSEYDDGTIPIFQGDIHLANSNFNKHRKAIIRYVVETNLSTSISGFTSSVNKDIDYEDAKYTDFKMPKISETDWEIIENNVCAISFLQGLKMGSKSYNGYAVVANMLTKEYIDENDIYILKENNTYCKTNDSTLTNDNIKQKSIDNNYYPGIWKIDFEKRKYTKEDGTEEYYFPTGSNVLGSYTSIIGSNEVNEIGMDMYTYMKNQTDNDNLRKAYYMALGRERWGSFNINNINYELNGNNRNEYFLEDY